MYEYRCNMFNNNAERLYDQLGKIKEKKYILLFSCFEALDIQNNRGSMVDMITHICDTIQQSLEPVMVFFTQLEVCTVDEFARKRTFNIVKLYAPPPTVDEIRQLINDFLHDKKITLHPAAFDCLVRACAGYTYNDIKMFICENLVDGQIMPGMCVSHEQIKQLLYCIALPVEETTVHINSQVLPDVVTEDAVFSLTDRAPYVQLKFYESLVENKTLLYEWN